MGELAQGGDPSETQPALTYTFGELSVTVFAYEKLATDKFKYSNFIVQNGSEDGFQDGMIHPRAIESVEGTDDDKLSYFFEHLAKSYKYRWEDNLSLLNDEYTAIGIESVTEVP